MSTEKKRKEGTGHGVDLKDRQKVEPPKKFKVVLHNDDYTPMELVVLILVEVFNKGLEEANSIMMKVHKQGKGIAGVYSKEIAETKTKVLKPLKFFKFKPQIQNGIMLDQEVDFDEIDNLQKIDETFASNYFEILIDEAVDRSKVCELDPDRKSDDLFIKDPVVCPTTTEAKTFTYDPVDEADLDYLEEELQEDCE